jgi:hypothetical protein
MRVTIEIRDRSNFVFWALKWAKYHFRRSFVLSVEKRLVILQFSTEILEIVDV